MNYLSFEVKNACGKKTYLLYHLWLYLMMTKDKIIRLLKMIGNIDARIEYIKAFYFR